VNALAFHPTYGTLATGGGDGAVLTWDLTSKKRICALAEFGTAVSSLAFSPSGSHIAVAASYGWEQGDPALLASKPPADAIHVREVSDAECRPKPAAEKK
jgi:cell cycle arrest protein BUB3